MRIASSLGNIVEGKVEKSLGTGEKEVLIEIAFWYIKGRKSPLRQHEIDDFFKGKNMSYKISRS